MSEILQIHASALADYGDCPRRAAAKFLYKEIANDYGLATSHNTIGSTIGTVLHKYMAEMFRTKLRLGYLADAHIHTALEQIWPEFEKATEKETIWDKSGPTRHTEDARVQLQNMARAFMPLAQYIEPAKIEYEFKHKVSPLGNEAVPIILVGTMDLKDTRNGIHDWKTGKDFPNFHYQGGAYTILNRLHEEDVSSLTVNFVPRKPVSKQHEVACRSVRLNVEECVAAAWSMLREVQRHHIQWLESKDSWSFPANPQGYLCASSYCTAFGTNWCKVGNTLREDQP